MNQLHKPYIDLSVSFFVKTKKRHSVRMRRTLKMLIALWLSVSILSGLWLTKKKVQLNNFQRNLLSNPAAELEGEISSLTILTAKNTHFSPDPLVYFQVQQKKWETKICWATKLEEGKRRNRHQETQHKSLNKIAGLWVTMLWLLINPKPSLLSHCILYW